MGQIHFPPTGVFNKTIVPLQCCLQWGEALTIYFDVSGYFACLTPGLFNPDLPMGSFVAPVSIGPYDAVSQDATAILTFYDAAADKLYVETVTIQQAPCKKEDKCT